MEYSIDAFAYRRRGRSGGRDGLAELRILVYVGTYVDIFTSREINGRRDRQTGEATNIAVPKVGTVGNSAAPPPPFGLLTVLRCDDIFFSFLKVGTSARGNEFVLQVELSQGGPGQTRSNIGHIFFLSCKG